MMVSCRSFVQNISKLPFFPLPEVNREDLETLVTSDDLLANNVHNNGGDNLLLIENGEIKAINDNKNKKSNIFTWRENILQEDNQIQFSLIVNRWE